MQLWPLPVHLDDIGWPDCVQRRTGKLAPVVSSSRTGDCALLISCHESVQCIIWHPWLLQWSQSRAHTQLAANVVRKKLLSNIIYILSCKTLNYLHPKLSDTQNRDTNL